MVRKNRTCLAFPRPLIDQSIYAPTVQGNRFPIQVIEINWGRLLAKRSILLTKIDGMPNYLLHPEINMLLEQESHPTYRLIMDLMWALGARVSEVLALRPMDFIDDGDDIWAMLHTLKRGGRPTDTQTKRYPKRYIPIQDAVLIDRLNTYLREHPCRKERRMFGMCRQTVNRHIHSLVEGIGGMPVRVSSRTFRHSFAVHLILHGRPSKYVRELLGHKPKKPKEITDLYTNVLAIDSKHILDGVDFH